MTTLRHPFHLLALSLYLSLFPVSQASASTYITEEKVQIDRCACAWFITRFLDESPNFTFIKQGESPPNGITYDFFGASYFHRGPDCSFTAFIKRHIKKKNQALIKMNAVVNDVFAWRNGPNSLSVSIKKSIDSLLSQGKTDEQVYQECMLTFDLLYLINQGDDTDMNKKGKLALASTERRVLIAVYGEQLPLTPQEITQLEKINRSPALNSSFLRKVLAAHPPQNNTSTHALILQILKKKP